MALDRVAIDFPYGHTYGLRRLIGEESPLTEEELVTQETLQAESLSAMSLESVFRPPLKEL
jgi:ParB family chromosome partitioning protein